MRDIHVAYCDERHGYCVFEQTTRGNYVFLDGPYYDAEFARQAAKDIEEEE